MNIKRVAILTALIFIIGILFGSFIGANFGLVSINTSVGLLDISLVVVALLGPFLAVEHASFFVPRDIRTEIACIQQYKIIDDIDRSIRKLIHATQGKSSINTTESDLRKWLKLATKLEYMAGSPWLSNNSDLLTWIDSFKTVCNEAISGTVSADDKHTTILNAVSCLSKSRQKYFQDFVQQIKTSSL